VLQLIANYQGSARATVAELQNIARTNDLLSARRRGKLPRTGRLPEPGGRYSFHGVGCRFEVAKRVIDVDFGPDGRHDGFDAWRLEKFADSAFEWSQLSARDIESGLKHLEVTRVIANPRWDPSPHLYYCVEDMDMRNSRKAATPRLQSRR
jgi:hypothetical protein